MKGSLIALGLLLTIVFLSLSSCNRPLWRKEQERVLHSDTLSNRHIMAYSLAQISLDDSLSAEVVVWPEGNFRYSLQEGYQGSARKVLVRYQQQQKRQRSDSHSIRASQQQSASSTQVSSTITQRHRSGSMPMRIIGSLLLVVLLLVAMVYLWQKSRR